MFRLGLRVRRAVWRQPARVLRAAPLGVRFASSEIKAELTNFESVPETVLSSNQLGYLDLIGMANGWGPTGLVERLLEVTHVYTGLPWWGTIVTATLLVRVVLFPFYMRSSDNMARMAKIKPELDAIVKEAQEAEHQSQRMQAMMKRKKLMKEHNVKVLYTVFPLMQLPVAIGFMRALSKMAAYPVDGFWNQGAYWFENLLMPDPYLGLQILGGATVMAMVQFGGELGQTVSPAMKKLLIGLPILSLIVTKDFSAAVCLYLAAGAFFGVAQTRLLRLKTFRRVFKMEPFPKPNVTQNQPQTIGDLWKNMNTKFQKQAELRMDKADKKLRAIKKRTNTSADNFVKRR